MTRRPRSGLYRLVFHDSKLKILLPLLATGVFLSHSHAATNLLVNGGFEDPEGTNDGNNLGVVVTGWTPVVPDPQHQEDYYNNIVRPHPDYTDGPSVAHTDAQYYDLRGTGGYIFQDVTMTAETHVQFGAWFSRRAVPSDANGHVEIWDLGDNSFVSSSPEVTIASSEDIETWKQSAATALLGPGTYQVRVHLNDPANVDTVSMSAMPEPGGALAGLLLGAAMLRRNRRGRRATQA